MGVRRKGECRWQYLTILFTIFAMVSRAESKSLLSGRSARPRFQSTRRPHATRPARALGARAGDGDRARRTIRALAPGGISPYQGARACTAHPPHRRRTGASLRSWMPPSCETSTGGWSTIVDSGTRTSRRSLDMSNPDSVSLVARRTIRASPERLVRRRGRNRDISSTGGDQPSHVVLRRDSRLAASAAPIASAIGFRMDASCGSPASSS